MGLLCDGLPTVTRLKRGARKIGAGRALFRLVEFQVLERPEVRSGNRSNNDGAGPDVDTADPVARIDHHALTDRIHALALEIDDAGGPQGGNGPAGLAAELFQLDVHGHAG